MLPVPNYESLYLVSELGDVYSLRTGKFLTPTYVGKSRRPYVLLHNKGKRELLMLAKLVYEVYGAVKNFDGVYHKNDVLQDCEDTNLRSCSAKTQRSQALRAAGRGKGVYKWSDGKYERYRVAFNVDGETKTFGYYKSEEEAEKAFKEKYLEIYGVPA